MSIQQNTNISQYVPKSSSSSLLSSKTGLLDRPPMSSAASNSRSVFGRSRFRSMTIPENDREDKLTTEVPQKKALDAQKRRNSWFTSISIIKSLSSNSISPFLRGKESLNDSMDLASEEKVDQESQNPGELKAVPDTSETDMPDEIQLDEPVDHRSSGGAFSQCNQSDVIDHICTDECNFQEEDMDSNAENAQKPTIVVQEFSWNTFITEACSKTSILVRQGVEKLGVLSQNMRRVPELISKDSFRYLRYTISAILLVFSLTFFLLTLFQERDIYERIFHILIENIEIKNPKNAARPI